MEYFIAFFVGAWVSVGGVMAYRRIRKDFEEAGASRGQTGQDARQKDAYEKDVHQKDANRKEA